MGVKQYIIGAMSVGLFMVGCSGATMNEHNISSELSSSSRNNSIQDSANSRYKEEENIIQKEDFSTSSFSVQNNKSKWQFSKEGAINYLYVSFMLALQHNKRAEAYSLSKQLLEYPLPEKMYTEIASFYLMDGKRSEATAVLERSTNENPSSFEGFILWSEVVEDKSPVLSRLEHFVERNPLDRDARIRLYSLYQEHRHFNKMLALAESTDKKQYSYIDDFYSGIAYGMLGDTNKGAEKFSNALRKEPSFAEAWLELGLMYENISDYSSAQKVYSQGIVVNPNYSELWIRLVGINVTLNKPKTALEYVKQGPQNKVFLLSATSIFMENAHYPQATKVLKMIEQIHPDSKEIHFYYAFLYVERDRNLQKALWHLEQVPENSPLYPRAVQLQVSLYQSKRSFAEAVLVAKRAKESMPDIVEFWDIYGQSLRASKKYSEAIKVYEEGLKRFPDSIPLLYGLASVYNEEDSIPLAMKYMERILEIDNDNIQALNYVGYTLTEQNKDLSKAKILLEKAFFLDNTNVSVIDSLAWLYYKQRRYNDAFALLQKAKDIGIEDPIIWEHYAEVASTLGMKKEAMDAYKKVLEHNPTHAKAKEYIQR